MMMATCAATPDSPPFDPNVGQISETFNPMNEDYLLRKADPIDT